MDTILVVSYSHTGTSRQLARLLCAQNGWPYGEITDAVPRRGLTGTLRCVLDSLLVRTPSIDYHGPDPADFHLVVLVAPIWVYRLAGPMRTFITGRRDALHHVALATTMGSAGASNAVSEVGRLLGRPPSLAAAFTAREVLDGSCAQAAADFGLALRGQHDGVGDAPESVRGKFAL